MPQEWFTVDVVLWWGAGASVVRSESPWRLSVDIADWWWKSAFDVFL